MGLNKNLGIGKRKFFLVIVYHSSNGTYILMNFGCMVSKGEEMVSAPIKSLWFVIIPNEIAVENKLVFVVTRPERNHCFI